MVVVRTIPAVQVAIVIAVMAAIVIAIVLLVAISIAIPVPSSVAVVVVMIGKGGHNASAQDQHRTDHKNPFHGSLLLYKVRTPRIGSGCAGNKSREY